MRFVLFYHSLLSDWNHGNAHFLRGYASELVRRGHEVRVYEPRPGWSLDNLLRDHGERPLAAFRAAYPELASTFYAAEGPGEPELDALLADADVVIVHEWSEPALVGRIGAHRRRHGGYRLLFHDTHHRLVTAPEQMRAYDLRDYDAVLAFGEVLRELYRDTGRCERAFTWHEAADTTRFVPTGARATDLAVREFAGEFVWIGNWGDEERTSELHEFLLEPVRALGGSGRVHGVRYPEAAKRQLAEAGLHYGGWLPNFCVPEIYGRFAATLHVPRRPYAEALAGVPTIRVFEALACGIPLVSAPWSDRERLFAPDRDFLVARDGSEMKRLLNALRHEPELRARLSRSGLATVRARHTCAHRVDELLAIVDQLTASRSAPSEARREAFTRGGSACQPS